MTRVRATAPGRVNLIGDHTDYTGGLVLPMVLDRSTNMTGFARDDGMIHVVSADEPVAATFPADVDDPENIEPHWARYVAGMVREMRLAGAPTSGFEASIDTDIPIGSGLSSSAALEVVTGRFVRALIGDHAVDDVTMALAAQRAEHRASGVPCGIMDQLCIAVGRPGSATLIDCHDLSYRHVNLPDSVRVDVRFVTRRTLVGSEYADRVSDCHAIESSIGPLRLATSHDVESIHDPRLKRRARHVVSENRRVRDAVSAIELGDMTEFGRLMTESHRSLADDYETSNTAMDEAVERLLAESDVLGARMTGGGFGGCVVALRRRG
jgi:galactokinase